MSFWDRVAGLYDFAEGFNGEVYRGIVRFTGKLIPEGAAVLDCAAGTGELSIAASKKARSVRCTDYSEKMLNIAREKVEKLGITNIGFEQASIFNINAPDETYDVTIAGNVLHLLDDPEAAVRELARVTKSGGRLLLPCFTTAGKAQAMINVYKLFGYRGKAYTPYEYCCMLADMDIGSVKAKVFDGVVPCCYVMITKK
ncbi:MAG: class I SAM-dependent methyltransferase [Oscillospiraceae bacterium]